jgi:hypothetical protein
VASAPDTLTLSRHRDGKGSGGPWARRVAVAAVTLIPLAALLNAFGQRPDTSTAATSSARLQIYAPMRARSGLIYAARFRVDAVRDLKRATVVLDPGWAEQYTVNGIAPQPVSEGSHDGKLEFVLGHIAKGAHYTLWISLQINPTNVGHRPQTVSLYDGGRLLLVIRRTITIWP